MQNSMCSSLITAFTVWPIDGKLFCIRYFTHFVYIYNTKVKDKEWPGTVTIRTKHLLFVMKYYHLKTNKLDRDVYTLAAKIVLDPAQYLDLLLFYLSRDLRKPDFCICENKDADQLRGNREADQRLCFRYPDSTIPLLSKYEISSL